MRYWFLYQYYRLMYAVVDYAYNQALWAFYNTANTPWGDEKWYMERLHMWFSEASSYLYARRGHMWENVQRYMVDVGVADVPF